MACARRARQQAWRRPAPARSRLSTMIKRRRPRPTVREGLTGHRRPREIAAAEAHVRGLLEYIGEDPDREGLIDTPGRVVRAMSEHFSGYAMDAAHYLQRTFEEVEGYDELVLVSDIEVYSHCEHHMVPF